MALNSTTESEKFDFFIEEIKSETTSHLCITLHSGSLSAPKTIKIISNRNLSEKNTTTIIECRRDNNHFARLFVHFCVWIPRLVFHQRFHCATECMYIYYISQLRKTQCEQRCLPLQQHLYSEAKQQSAFRLTPTMPKRAGACFFVCFSAVLMPEPAFEVLLPHCSSQHCNA